MALPRVLALRGAGPWRWVLTGGIALLLLLVLGVGGWSWYRAVQARGVRELLQASALGVEALRPEGTVSQHEAAVSKLEETIARYPSNQMVPQAAYHLGNLRYQAGAYDAAREAFALALAKGGRGALAALCRLGLGYTWEAQGKHGEALDAYQEARRYLGADDFLYEETLMSVARAQELTGKLSQARETYRRILEDLPETRRAVDIRWRLATLSKPSQP